MNLDKINQQEINQVENELIVLFHSIPNLNTFELEVFERKLDDLIERKRKLPTTTLSFTKQVERLSNLIVKIYNKFDKHRYKLQMLV